MTAGSPGQAPALAEQPAPGERPGGPRWRWLAATRRYLAGFSLAGLAGALAFYCLSLTPSLLPRAWYLQAVMSAVTSAIGYAVGLFAGWLLRSLIPWRPGQGVRRAGRLALAVAAAVLIPLFGVLGAQWQHDIRELNGGQPAARGQLHPRRTRHRAADGGAGHGHPGDPVDRPAHRPAARPAHTAPCGGRRRGARGVRAARPGDDRGAVARRARRGELGLRRGGPRHRTGDHRARVAAALGQPRVARAVADARPAGPDVRRLRPHRRPDRPVHRHGGDGADPGLRGPGLGAVGRGGVRARRSGSWTGPAPSTGRSSWSPPPREPAGSTRR